MIETNHSNSAEITFRSYAEKTVYAEEPTAPTIRTLMSILGPLVVSGKLKRTELHRRTRISYASLIKYIQWLKWKNLVIDDGSHIAVSESGRGLYDLLV